MELTSPAFAAEVAKDPVLILPIGALEEHGPHLPLGTDIYQPRKLVKGLAERTGALVAPEVIYGNCQSTDGFPGTVSISFDALRFYVRDILIGFYDDGIRRFLVVSGHAGGTHMNALKEAARDLAMTREVRIMVLSDYDIIYGLGEMDPKDGHGGKIETSRVLAARPDLVGPLEGLQDSEYPNRYLIRKSPEKAWNGFSGKASEATKELGERIDAQVLEAFVDIVKDLKEGALGE